MMPASGFLLASASIAHRIAERQQLDRDASGCSGAGGARTGKTLKARRAGLDADILPNWRSRSIEQQQHFAPATRIEARDGEQPRLVLRVADDLKPASQRAMAGADMREPRDLPVERMLYVEVRLRGRRAGTEELVFVVAGDFAREHVLPGILV